LVNVKEFITQNYLITWKFGLYWDE